VILLQTVCDGALNFVQFFLDHPVALTLLLQCMNESNFRRACITASWS